ncbi:Exosome complex component RRP42 [Yarrowia sp. C11]|nr:Exosome complex component RRP42 [Yarrowia sp. E02]KAG5369232.1 Exosome complex component RRP42 [Yarrowia sp. C11]
MPFSPAEIDYLRKSLQATPTIRPDAREPNQFRPVDAAQNFLPATNGSARIRTSDGGECIVGVKAKVVKNSSVDELIAVEVDIDDIRDDSPLPKILSAVLQTLILSSIDTNRLRLTRSNYAFKLHIDALVLSHTSFPLNLVSLAIFLALKCTRLPLLVSSANDEEHEEVPVFSDDWEESLALCGGEILANNSGSEAVAWTPPLVFALAVVGNNILVDPTHEEESVSDLGLIMGWCNGQVCAPIRIIDLASAGGNVSPEQLSQQQSMLEQGIDLNLKGTSRKLIMKAYSLLTHTAPEVVAALDATAEEEDGALF